MAGQVLFQARCISCHAGEYATDSGAGNPTLDWSGPVVLHDVGTCVTSGAHPDRASTAVSGVTRSPCELDTPSLRGVFATPPYFHDGSAPTLLDTLDRLPFSSDLSADDKARLVEYLETL
jgi:cytochrome c peroxidase